MGWYPPSQQHEFFAQLPKVELHRHLEGSLRLQTMLDIAAAYSMTMPLRPPLSNMVQMQPEDALNFSNFLSKFQTLRLFYRSPEVITRVTSEAVEDAAADNVAHLELRFTPVALGRIQAFPLAEVMEWVCTSAYTAALKAGISTRLIVSVNRHEDPKLAEEVADLAVQYRSKGVVALDLAGNEAEYPTEPFLDIFRQAKAAGLKITIHAGEWGGAANVTQAIRDFKADRVAHGVRVLEDENAVALAREHGTPFEVCITSNYHSGVTPALSEHPFIRMLNAGLNVTLNTDDPSISQITLTDEYCLACENLGLPRPVLAERIQAAALSAFLPGPAVMRLWEKLDPGLKALGSA